MSDTSVIELLGISVSYGKKSALSDVSLRVAPNAVYALLGRNGAGKSSAIRCLLGQQKPTRGNVLLFGRDAWKERAALMIDVGVVPEEPDAPGAMNAAALGRFCAALNRKFSVASYEAQLARFSIPTSVAFAQLSKGQKGHVMLALALAPAPKLLVLDDPTLGLDAIARKNFFEELVVDLAERGTTVFMTTHDLAGIEGIATHVGILAGARLVIDEELEQLKARFRRVSYPRDEALTQSLAALKPTVVDAREWGNEAVVAGYSDAAFATFRSNANATARIEAQSMPLDSIFGAVLTEVTP